MDHIQPSITTTVEAMEAAFDGRWGIWLSDTGHWWASRRDSLSAASLAVGCVPFLRTDTPGELTALIREQEALTRTQTDRPSQDGTAGGESDDDTWEMPALSGEQAALEALCWHWGEVYEIGVDDGQWWYRRRDGKGGTETAITPDELRTQIITDYTIMPVPRPVPSGDTADVEFPDQAAPGG
jgi:hypothetical protein